MTMSLVIIPSRASESSDEAICRPCGVIIQASRRAYQERLAYTVSTMEFRNGKVIHETQYFGDPFEAPACRRQWVQQIA
jgi:hypothetical protein